MTLFASTATAAAVQAAVRADTAIAGPDGTVLAEPLSEQAGMLVATVDRADLVLDRREIGPTSHYARADVFQPAVHNQRRRPRRNPSPVKARHSGTRPTPARPSPSDGRV